MSAVGINRSVHPSEEFCTLIESCVYVPTTIQHSVDQEKCASACHVSIFGETSDGTSHLNGQSRENRASDDAVPGVPILPTRNASRDVSGRRRFVGAKLTPQNVA